jgi:hypothetical protein
MQRTKRYLIGGKTMDKINERYDAIYRRWEGSNLPEEFRLDALFMLSTHRADMEKLEILQKKCDMMEQEFTEYKKKADKFMRYPNKCCGTCGALSPAEVILEDNPIPLHVFWCQKYDVIKNTNNRCNEWCLDYDEDDEWGFLTDDDDI